MVSVEPAFENLHYLRYKHKFGREYGRYWKETARSAPMDDQYTQAHEATMSYYQNMSIAQGAAMNAKNGGGSGYGERFRGPFRGIGRARRPMSYSPGVAQQDATYLGWVRSRSRG